MTQSAPPWVLERTGATARQIHHWCRKYLGMDATGTRREYTSEVVEACRIMALIGSHNTGHNDGRAERLFRLILAAVQMRDDPKGYLVLIPAQDAVFVVADAHQVVEILGSLAQDQTAHVVMPG